MKLPFFGAKKTADEKAREQALKQQQQDEKARLAALAKEQKAHDKRARQAAKAEKQRQKQQAREWTKQEKLLRARARKDQQRIDARDKQERKRIAKLEKLHAAARRREARRARKQLQRQRRKLKKLEKRQRKQQDAQHDHEIHALRTAIAASPARSTSPLTVTTASPAFKKRAHCGTCRTQFCLTKARHHCRNCGESCCRQCLSATKRPVPWHGKRSPQKICVTCDALVFSDRTAVAARAAVATAEPLAAAAASQSSDGGTASPPVSSSSSSNSRPASGSGISISLATRRVRRNNSGSMASTASSASTASLRKKPSLWTLPIRPLLKRKRSVEQLRNRQLDFALQLEKAAQLTRQGQRSIAVELEPQHTLLAPPLARAS